MTRTAHVLIPYSPDMPEDLITEAARQKLQRHAVRDGYTVTSEPIRHDDVTEHGIPNAHYTATAEPLPAERPDGYLDRRPA